MKSSLSLWDDSHDLLRANYVSNYMFESIIRFHLGMSQFISCVVLMKWSQNKDAREKSREGEFPQGWYFGNTTSLERRYRISAHGYKSTLDWRVVNWGNDSLKKNSTTSYFALSLYIVFPSLSLYMYQSRYIHVLLRQAHEYLYFHNIYIFMIIIYKNLSWLYLWNNLYANSIYIN